MKARGLAKDDGRTQLGAGLGESGLLTFGLGGATELTHCHHR